MAPQTEVEKSSPPVITVTADVARLRPRPVSGESRATQAEALPNWLPRAGLRRYVQPWAMTLSMAGMDLLMVSVAAVAAVYGRHAFGQPYDPGMYLKFWPLLTLFPLGYLTARLYPGVGISPPEELRRATCVSTMVYLGLVAALFLTKDAERFSRGAFLIAWGLTTVLVPMGRGVLRAWLSRCAWWGQPVLVLGAGKTGRMVVEAMRKHPQMGLKPIAVLDDDPAKRTQVAGVPVLGGLDLAARLAAEHHLNYAVFAMPGIERQRLVSLVDQVGRPFQHVMVMPDLLGIASLWVSARDMGGMLGLEVQKQLLIPRLRWTKRMLDVLVVTAFAPLLVPMMAVIALLIRLDSRGPVLFVQKRPGENGRIYRILKFRTMYHDEGRFENGMSEADREVQQEYGKVPNDPRRTRVGRILRRFSLDELPQVWNVIRGDMSVVGPRPYLKRQYAQIPVGYEVIFHTRPGITGLWQVSGRNDLTLEQRLDLDAYYVRNWSVWLDLFILARTARAVLTGRGAY